MKAASSSRSSTLPPYRKETTEEIGSGTEYVPFEVDPLQRDVYSFSLLAMLWKLSDSKKIQHRIIDHVGYYSLRADEPAAERETGSPKG